MAGFPGIADIRWQRRWIGREQSLFLLRNSVVTTWHAACDVQRWVPDHVSFTLRSRRGRSRTAGELRRVWSFIHAWVTIAARGLSEYFRCRCNGCGRAHGQWIRLPSFRDHA
jgi:hypothetical protein